MRQFVALLSLFALTANAAEAVYPLRGYTSANSAKEVQWEEKFRQIPDTANLRDTCAGSQHVLIMLALLMTRPMRNGFLPN